MRSLSCLKFLAPTSACVNSRRRSWQRRWHASRSAPAAPPGRPGPRGPGGRVNCRPFARRWWSALGSCRSARPCGGRLQHSHASAGVLDRMPPTHQPGSRAPLSACVKRGQHWDMADLSAAGLTPLGSTRLDLGGDTAQPPVKLCFFVMWQRHLQLRCF